MIDNEFGNDILTLEDDDGVEHTFEVLDAIDNGENRYMALSPVYDDPGGGRPGIHGPDPHLRSAGGNPGGQRRAGHPQGGHR